MFHVALSPGPSKGLLCARHQPQHGLVFKGWLVGKEQSVNSLPRAVAIWTGLGQRDLNCEMDLLNSDFLFQTSPTFTKGAERTSIWDWSWEAQWGFGCCITSLEFSEGHCRDRLCFSTSLWIYSQSGVQRFFSLFRGRPHPLSAHRIRMICTLFFKITKLTVTLQQITILQKSFGRNSKSWRQICCNRKKLYFKRIPRHGEHVLNWILWQSVSGPDWVENE